MQESRFSAMKWADGDGTLDVWIALCEPCLMPASLSHCVDINLQYAIMPEDNAIPPLGLHCTQGTLVHISLLLLKG